MPHNLIGEVALAKYRIAEDDLVLQRQQAQELQGRFVLVGLGIDTQLRQHGLDLGGVRSQQMLTGQVAVSTAFERLAIQG